MIDKKAEQAVFMKDEKWTPDSNVNPIYERQRLAFNREGMSDIDPNELAAQLVALSAQVPKETVLFEDALEEAVEAADDAAEAYSRPLIMSVIADRLVSACEVLDGIPREHHDALLTAFDLVFGAGRDYQHIEFSEKFLRKIEDGIESREIIPSSGGNATAQIHRPVTTELVNFMDDYMKRHPTRGVKPAAEEATKRGYGAQKEGATLADNVAANRARYYRFKKSKK